MREYMIQEILVPSCVWSQLWMEGSCQKVLLLHSNYSSCRLQRAQDFDLRRSNFGDSWGPDEHPMAGGVVTTGREGRMECDCRLKTCYLAPIGVSRTLHIQTSNLTK